jgi:hypothetical protein
MPNKKNNPSLDIDAEFTDIIRERMTDTQFWNWITGWKDEEELCDEAEEWDEEDKLDTINSFNKGDYNSF